MSTDRLQFPEVVITGGLGGLGTTIALAIRTHGAPVKVIDVMHPGCAPFSVFAHRKSLLEGAGVIVELADMRSDDVANRTMTYYPNLEMELKPFWIHCASPPPPDVPGVPVSRYEELAYSTPAHWIGLAIERGWWYMVNQHLPAVLSDDARLFYESWIAVFDAESRLRREFQPEVMHTHHPGLFPMVPGLFGMHQSPHTTPLRQYLQVLAGREVSVCAFDKPFGMSLLDSVAHDIVQVLQSFASSMGHEVDISANPYPDYLARCEDWLIHLRKIFKLPRVQVRSDQGPGAYYATSAYGHRLSQLPEFEGSGFAVMTADQLRRIDSEEFDKLLLSWKELPWVPPVDWPEKISKGRGRRKRSS